MPDAVQRYDLALAIVPVPVGQHVAGDSVEPCRKWNALVLIIVNVLNGPKKYPGGQIFRIVTVADPIVDVIINAIDV